MTNDDSLWDEAVAIDRTHGPNAARWVAERTVASNLAGDDAEVRRLREIAVRLDELLARRTAT